MKRRRLFFTTFDQLLTEVDHLQTEGYTAAGQWNLAQICDHLRIIIDQSMRGFGDIQAPRAMRIAGPLML